MTAKIIRGDGTTDLTGIKTCTYTERVNAGQDLRPGCVASAFINVTVYGSQSTAPTAGEALKYYQVDSNGNETLIGTFYAEPSIPSRNTYAFVAYDAVSKLDADFSDWLASNQSNFPMTMYNLVSAACTVAGVTLGSSSWLYSTRNINAFYADGITCRNILEYASELSCKFVRCNSTGAVIFDWYSVNSTGISPSGSQTTVAYKQDGLNYDNYTAEVDAVSVYPVGVDSAAYTYPSGTTGNILRVTNNALLYGANSTMMTNNARTIYDGLDAIGSYRPAMIQLFPFENPFRAGDIVTVTDIQGVTFQTVIMAMTVTESVSTIESYGHDEVWNERNTAREAIQLATAIVNIEKAKIGWAEINELFAQNITATGSFQVNNSAYKLVQDSNGLSLQSKGTVTPAGSTGTRQKSNMVINDNGIVMDVFDNLGYLRELAIVATHDGSQGGLHFSVQWQSDPTKFSKISVAPETGVEFSDVNCSIVPIINGLWSIGSSANRWANIYANAITLNGSDIGTTLSGLTDRFSYQNGVNLNNLTIAGLYYCNAPTNGPSGTPFTSWAVEVFASGTSSSSAIKQVARAISSEGTEFERHRISGTWSAWSEVGRINPFSGTFSSTTWFRKPGNATYGSFIIVGTFGGLGGMSLLGIVNNSSLSSLINLRTGEAYSSTALTVSYGVTDGVGYVGFKTSSSSGSVGAIIGG